MSDMGMMTVSEVAKRTGKTAAAIYVAINRGWLKAERQYGIWLVSPRDLKDYNPKPRGRPRSESKHAIRTDISQSDLARELGVSRQRVHQIINKEAHLARCHVQLALKDGRLIKPDTCERCGEAKRLEAHHPDYTKRLEVIWLCAPCHSLVHPHHSNINGKMESLRYGHGRPRKQSK